MTLRQKLIGTQGLAMLAVLVAMAWYYQYGAAAAERELADKLTSAAELLARNSESTVVFLDEAAATEVLASLEVEQQVMDACIYDESGKVFASYHRQDVVADLPAAQVAGVALGQDQIEVFHPLRSGGTQIGTVYLRSDLRWLEARRGELLRQTAILIVVGGGISLVLLLLLQRSLAAPLQRLAVASARVAEDESQSHVEGGGTDELVALANAFNRMVEQVQARDRSLREARDTLEHRVDERTAELRQATEAVQQELDGRLAAEERIQSLVDSAAAGMLVVDAQGTMVLVNDHFVSMFGYSREEMIGQPSVLLVPEDARGIHQRELQEFVDNPDDPAQGRLRALHGRRKDGSEMPVEIGIAPMRTQEGLFVSMVVIDVTDRKQAMAELQAARDLAERTNAAKSAFMANVSHELRTPLNGIIGAAEILQHGTFGQLSPQQQEYIGTVLEGGQQLLRLINDIVDVARMESGEVALAPGAVSLGGVLDELQAAFGERASEKGLSFAIDQEGEVPAAIVIDGQRLRQVLGSLIDNGVKFTKQGSVLLLVHSRQGAEVGQCTLTFRVRDTGPGIPADQQQGIFQAFTQREGQSINEHGGVGIGLAMSKRIVDSMDGELRLHSVVGEGTTFEVVLPDLPTASLEDTIVESEQIDADRIEFRSAKVLVADDVHTNRYLVKGFLETHGLSVIEAENGTEAIDIVRRERPDLVLMDIKMPVLDGFKATERLKSNPELAEIPVVALTASVMRESEGEIRELFDGFLRKPVQREHLVSELASLLPHDTKEAEAEVDEEEVAEAAPEWSVEALDDVARSRLPELMTALEGEVQSAWEEASRTLIVNDVEALGARASELGGEFEFEPLREWGERLGVQASTFQMDVMPQTLDEFPQLVTQLREVVPSAHGADESKT